MDSWGKIQTPYSTQLSLPDIFKELKSLNLFANMLTSAAVTLPNVKLFSAIF